MNRILLLILLLLCVHYSNAQITPSPAIMCGGSPVTISVPTGAATYQWQYSPTQFGSYSNVPGPGGISASYSATTAGWYQVIVNGTPSNPVEVINSPLPVPSFTFDNNNTCAGTTIHFTSSVSSGNPGYTYAWNFGDANTSTSQNPTHAYTTLGCATVNYTVTLTVTDSYGCTNTVSNTVQVKPKPDVQIADDDIFSPFSNCDNSPTAANPNFTLSVHNISPSSACITTYSIDWGDGNTQAGISFPISHTYTTLGAFPLTITGTSSNGCVNTKTYTVANQSNPAGGLGTLGSTTGLCAPATVPFIISNWENNSPGTSYLLDFGDGTTMILSHPLNGTSTPQTVNHTYITSSCPQPTFTATLKVYNACDTTPYTAGNIQVRIKPTANFTIVPTPGCINQAICFTNTTVAGTTGPACSAATAYSWDFGDPSSGTNTSTATSPCHTYTTPGTYTITLQATNPCGTSTITKTVCINAPLVPLFTIDNNLGCIPLAVNTTNTTDNSLNCSPATYAWTVTYAAGNCGVSSSYVFTGGTTATSLNPSFIFSNPGIYTITLSVTNSCGTVTTSKTVTVKKPPTVTIPVLPNICGSSSVTPTATVVNCGSGVLSYSWSFPGGSPSTSTSASPGTITYSTAGSYTISLSVTNECGTTTATQSVTVSPVPDFTAPANVSVCPGVSVGSFAFTSNPAGAVFTWTNSNTGIGLAASGSGTIPVFTATNITASPITGTITVTATLNGCTKINSFAITVNPKPALPVVTSPVIYCVGATALPLSATALPGNTLHWYTTAVGGVELGSAPTPSTASAGTTIYYVSQSSLVGNCEGNRAAITVTVNTIPSINVTTVNPATCGGTGSFTITGLTPNIAYSGSYTNTLGVIVPINAISSATGTITISGLIAGTYTNISVTLNGCPSNIIPSVTLTSPSQPAAPTAGNNGPMCSGGTLTLSASTVAGGTYQWTGPGGFNSASQNPTILNVTIAATGTYTVTVSVAGCVSLPATTNVTINQTPSVPVITSNSPVCAGNTITLNATSTAGAGFSWTGPGGYTSSIANPTIPNAQLTDAGTYIVTATLGTCSSTASTNIIVKPTPVISATFQNPTTCGGADGKIIINVNPGGTYLISYVKNAVTITNSYTSIAGVITIGGLSAGTYSNFNVSLLSCPANPIGPFILSDPSAPATPNPVNDGPVCSGGTIQLSITPVANATYLWTGPLGYSQGIFNPVISPATVAASGVYSVTVTVAGCVSQPGTTNVIINPTAATPTAGSNAPICANNNLNLTSNTTTPGNVSYAWTSSTGFTSVLQNPTISSAQPINSGTYTVIATVTTNGQACPSAPTTINVVVKPVPQINLGTVTNPTTCSGNDGSIQITGLTASTNYTVNYTYNAVPVSISLSSNGSGVLTIINLAQGTYTNISVSLAGCVSNILPPVSLADPSQPATPSAGSNSPVCSGNTISLNALSVTPGVSYLWSGPGGYSSNAQNPNIINSTVAMSGSYSVTVSLNGCTSSSASTPVVVNQTPALTAVTSNSPVCTGNTLNLNAATSTPGAMTYAWSGPNGFGSTNQNPSIPNVTVAANGIYSVVITATTGNCPSAAGTTNVVINATPVILSGTVTNPNACGSATGSINLNGLLPSTNYTINYTSSSGPQTLTATSNASGVVTIAGLSSGTYNNITVTLLGCVSAPVGPFTLNDPNPPAAPIVTSNSPLCAGGTLILNANSPAAGIISFQWTGPNGFISNLQNPTITNVTAANAGTYFVTVTVNNCVSPAASVLITINAQGALPSVISPVSYCIGTPSNPLTATANGGNTLNWYNVPTGGLPLGAAPVPSTATAGSTFYYVSQTTSFGCEGPRAPIEVKINPDARAVFVPTDTIKCAPFQLTATVIGLQLFPANNSNYLWYANNVLIGNGPVFPGYTINNQNDSVYIKLVAVSAFGCKNDSSTRKFKTYKVPVPSFTQSLAGGCGPVTVTFTNTTPDIADYTYNWNFGDGQTSNLQQPGPIVFVSSPTYNDTFYIVKLKVFSICDTITYSDTVFVNSKPKALFTPNNVNGCSPMRVTFTNTSLGTGNSYLWIFDDGQTYATNSTAPFEHIFNTGVIDTFHVKLIVTNGCGSDSIVYLIIAAPNSIHLNFSFNGTSQYGCAPHSMAFFNNSTGGGSFVWNFGDGNTITTTNNIDTIPHTFNLPGVYTVTVTALNNCTDTTATNTITVYAKPIPAFTASSYNSCIGQQIQFTNGSTGSSSVQWQFGDGTFSPVFSPVHTYATPGLYTVTLVVYNSNPSGNVCSDSIVHQVQVNATQPGNITLSANSSPCAPFTVTFDNLDIPAVTTTWDFGDGNTGTGNHVVHTYAVAGVYQVHVVATAPGGCTYITDKTVTVGGPAGSLQYTSGNVCYPASTFLQATATNADSYFWQFGDGNTQTTTAPSVFHQYQNPGTYIPSVTLQSNAGCSILLTGAAPIKVDKVTGGYNYAQISNCGATTLSFSDTSHAFFGTSQVKWDFGDTQTGTGSTINHAYLITGTYNVQMIVIGNSGCTDTVTKPIYVFVKSKPTAVIAGPTVKCGLENVSFTANINSADPVTIKDWLLSNGAAGSGTTFTYNFALPGTYTLRFIAGTSNGCFDTTFHTIQIKPVPTVVASGGITLCSGNTANLSVSGATTYQWTPIQGLSCNTCTNPVASPTVTTPYVVGGTTNGCTGYDTVIVTVIPPIRMTVSPNDSICIGQTALLQASGAATYIWNPAATLSSSTDPNPIATPTSTTIYRVIGSDGHNCFSDTAYITIGVGPYPIISLGPDLVLAAGTQQPLISTVQNGPLTQWLWTPSTNLNCNTCPQPIANIKKDITYVLLGTTAYGCSSSDTINIKVFCAESQVFIPNAFTPDGDGLNDILMVYGKGIVTVKHFRIFNRWGELVFERDNFSPNNPTYGWDGKVKGKAATPDVFVYTAEVMCENGTTFIYKGNISIIK